MMGKRCLDIFYENNGLLLPPSPTVFILHVLPLYNNHVQKLQTNHSNSDAVKYPRLSRTKQRKTGNLTPVKLIFIVLSSPTLCFYSETWICSECERSSDQLQQKEKRRRRFNTCVFLSWGCNSCSGPKTAALLHTNYTHTHTVSIIFSVIQ